MPFTPIYMIRSLLRSFSPVVCFPVLFHLSVCSFSDSFTSNIITHQSAESSVFLKKTPDYTQKRGATSVRSFSHCHIFTPLCSQSTSVLCRQSFSISRSPSGRTPLCRTPSSGVLTPGGTVLPALTRCPDHRASVMITPR